MFRPVTLCLCMILALPQDKSTELTVSAIRVAHRVPLTKALGEVGFKARGGFTSFGILVRSPEPEVEVYLPEETNLSAAVQGIVSQVPGYTYETVAPHLIDVYPASIRSEQSEPLNLLVADFRFADSSAMDLFSNPYRFIPELKAVRDKDKPAQTCGNIGPGLGSVNTGLEIALHNVTVKQILDAVAIADAASALESQANPPRLPVGWVLRSQTDPQTGKRVDDWSFMATVPRNWREPQK